MNPWGGKREGAGRPLKMGKPVEAGIKVNLTVADRKSLDVAAKRQGKGPSELARELILKGLGKSAKRSSKTRAGKKPR